MYVVQAGLEIVMWLGIIEHSLVLHLPCAGFTGASLHLVYAVLEMEARAGKPSLKMYVYMCVYIYMKTYTNAYISVHLRKGLTVELQLYWNSLCRPGGP